MLRCGTFSLNFERPLVMGIVNLTPDSFSGDGLGIDTGRAVAHAFHQIEAGADLLDLGAESSRPGAIPASLDEELDRLLPVLDALAGCSVPISVDTYKPEVMRVAIAHGVSMINDIFALRRPGAIEAVVESNCAVCLMHMQGEPLTMQQSPCYDNVIDEVRIFLCERIEAAFSGGISLDRIILDPGFGFGKSLEHNIQLLRCLMEISIDGLPLLAGISRKAMLGALTGRSVDQRVSASVMAAVIAAQRGAKILRVHDVAETVDALTVWQEISSWKT